ncbi:type I-E CRISPR-associated protein Cse2/CasB [Niveispirillum sp. BGYR6]|uniref:type I-E CRISPR-associated protein Cse2/CasB n=1 Tax=Niveispirillum sp. BGYR6 TaxID=2971249 RepID=UPI0022B99327|nr:type I-E CRISPR-associated protein Cse2/CasB [Niveispirillum sp. BGYR6]MDG5497353.1 type I-E CRISPR-associated protein Cse2/CasB [Niveispirillum sp. BGYR6]
MSMAETETKPARTIGQIVGALAGKMTKDRQGTGGMAQLRRMDPLGIPPPIFWKLLTDEFGAEPLPNNQETAWAIIIQSMAMMAPDGHRPKVPPGRVLADEGYPEGRFIRLLRAEGEGLATEIRTLARWSASKALAFDWADLAALVLARASRNPDWAEAQAIRLARPYFLAAGKKPGADTPVASGEEA